MLTSVEYPRLAGTNVPTDFVEYPPQFNEHWALEPGVLTHYAKHYQTGRPMPRTLVDKIKRARTYDQGFATTEYVAAALLDMAWHTLPVGPEQPDIGAFEAQVLIFFSSRRRHTRFDCDWSSDVCSSDLTCGTEEHDILRAAGELAAVPVVEVRHLPLATNGDR